MTTITLHCDDCGKKQRNSETWRTTEAATKMGRGWCDGCMRLRTAETLCEPTARLRAAQAARRKRSGY